jgi:hypothetical protein
MSTPALKVTFDLWQRTVKAADPYLDTLTTPMLQRAIKNRQGGERLIGSMLRRVTYHYWYHTGEIQSIRQLLGTRTFPRSSGPSTARRLTDRRDDSSGLAPRPGLGVSRPGMHRRYRAHAGCVGRAERFPERQARDVGARRALPAGTARLSRRRGRPV